MTATAPGLPVETPKDRTRSSKQNRPADQAVRESTGQSSSQKRTLQSPSASVPVDELHLTERLSPSVYLGRWVSAVCLEVFNCAKGSLLDHAWFFSQLMLVVGEEARLWLTSQHAEKPIL